ncbi:uncharacterized protein METZ01_LOCUS276533, partial [marine metagenome]
MAIKHNHEQLIDVDTAVEKVLSNVNKLEFETKNTLQALNHVCFENVIADIDIPPVNNSSMDGYAVKSNDVKGASLDKPVDLSVIGTISAGQIPDVEVVGNSAVKIMTGASIPQGANAVIPFEDIVTTKNEGIRVFAPVDHWNNIRDAGEDIKRGNVLIQKDKLISAADIGVMASQGLSKIKVVKKPVVAILATGNELMLTGEVLEKGKIYDSNSPAIAAAVIEAGGLPKLLGIAKDNHDSLNEKIDLALSCDLIITSAGVSKGDYDIVKDFINNQGEIQFWSVKMRPAKPIAFGWINTNNETRIPIIGLPGNPVSAMIAFEKFGRPAILKMRGIDDYSRFVIEAILDDPIDNHDGRRVYARGIVKKTEKDYHVSLTGSQQSNL